MFHCTPVFRLDVDCAHLQLCIFSLCIFFCPINAESSTPMIGGISLKQFSASERNVILALARGSDYIGSDDAWVKFGHTLYSKLPQKSKMRVKKFLSQRVRRESDQDLLIRGLTSLGYVERDFVLPYLRKFYDENTEEYAARAGVSLAKLGDVSYFKKLLAPFLNNGEPTDSGILIGLGKSGYKNAYVMNTLKKLEAMYLQKEKKKNSFYYSSIRLNWVREALLWSQRMRDLDKYGSVNSAFIRKLLNKKQLKIKSIDALLSHLPKSLRSNVLAFHFSQSTQPASPKFPRIVLYDKNFALAFSGDQNERFHGKSAKRAFNRLEMIDIDRNGNLSFSTYTFPDPSNKTRSKFNPKVPTLQTDLSKDCNVCHGGGIKITPYGSWIGNYSTFFSLEWGEEKMFKNDFWKKSKNIRRYRHLDLESFRGSFQSSRNLEEFNLLAGAHTGKRFAVDLAKHREFNTYKYAIAAALHQCPSFVNFLSGKLKQEYLASKEKIKTIYENGKKSAYQRRVKDALKTFKYIKKNSVDFMKMQLFRSEGLKGKFITKTYKKDDKKGWVKDKEQEWNVNEYRYSPDLVPFIFLLEKKMGFESDRWLADPYRGSYNFRTPSTGLREFEPYLFTLIHNDEKQLPVPADTGSYSQTGEADEHYCAYLRMRSLESLRKRFPEPKGRTRGRSREKHFRHTR